MVLVIYRTPKTLRKCQIQKSKKTQIFLFLIQSTVVERFLLQNLAISGHTWSPGYELSAGMLHGHAVATGMGFGAYLSHKNGWINDQEFKRILDLISRFL